MSAGHTPTPWSIDPRNGDIVSGPYNVTIPFACKDEDALFIVRAVNAHDELVEALRRLARLTPEAANASDAHDLHLTVQAIAESALSKALGNDGGEG